MGDTPVQITLVARSHDYWSGGEKDCPASIKAGNGELHTMMCKVCGAKNPRSQICWATIPDGYKLVPTEPTYEMLRRPAEHPEGLVDCNCGRRAANPSHDEARSIFKAMLAAAPVIAIVGGRN